MDEMLIIGGHGAFTIKRLWMVVGAVLAIVLAVVLVAPSMPTLKRLDPGDRAALEKEGAIIVAALDAYFEANGHLPRTLKIPGVARVRTEYGPWRYRRSRRPQRSGFKLGLGSYGFNMFELHWMMPKDGDSSGTWYWDT